MERIQERDEDGLRLLMERKAEKLHSFCTRYLGDREWAKDVVQEVFLKVWEQAAKFDPSYSVNTWVYRIAYNLSIDHIRTRRAPMAPTSASSTWWPRCRRPPPSP